MEALENINVYAKFMKNLVTKKRTVSFKLGNNIHLYSAVASQSLVGKKEDPRVFIILCTIRSFNFSQDLCDLPLALI